MNSNKINILIIDDDQKTLDLFRDLFDQENFNLSILKNIDQAIELYQNKNFSLIISELFINNVVTARLVNYLKEFGSKDVPLILINDFYNKDYQQLIKEKSDNISETLKKPIKKSDLLDCLKQVEFYSRNNIIVKENKLSIEESSSIISGGNNDFENENIIVSGSKEDQEKHDLKVKHLIEKAKELDLETLKDINFRGKDGKTPLMIFSEKNELDKVKILIEKGAQILLKCKVGRTALHYASLTNNVELVTYLIAQGAKLSSRDSNNADPMYYSIISKSNDILQEYIKLGARISGRVKGKTYLMTAASKNNLKGIQILFTAGADPNLVDDKGKTVTQQAQKRKQQGVLKILEAFKQMKEKKNLAA